MLQSGNFTIVANALSQIFFTSYYDEPSKFHLWNRKVFGDEKVCATENFNCLDAYISELQEEVIKNAIAKAKASKSKVPEVSIEDASQAS